MSDLVMETPSKTETQSFVRVGDILLGDNPRTRFDPTTEEEFRASIIKYGVTSPVMLRPVEGGLRLVFGHRRRHYAILERGEDYQIPALIREMTDEEEDAIKTIENTHRDAMSPADIAVDAGKKLARFNGDKALTATTLGISVKSLEKRLALLNCSDSVLNALLEEHIELAHAELLATVSKAKQDVVLKVVIEQKMPVHVLKKQLQAISKNLSDAIFDKTECANCISNSEQQTALFSEAIETGFCTKGSCYDQKTELELEKRKAEMQNDFPRVEIARTGDNFKIIKLVIEGPKGVGEEQAAACRACKNFGATVSAVPGKIGQKFTGACFDSNCNETKVQIRQDAIKAELKKSEKEAAAKAPASKAAVQTGKTSATSKVPATTAKVEVEETARLKEYRAKQWREITEKVILSSPVQAITLLISFSIAGLLRDIDTNYLRDAFGKMISSSKSFSNDVKNTITEADPLNAEQQQQLLINIVASCIKGIGEPDLIRVMTYLEIDMKEHWSINRVFLELLTKSELKVFAEQVGISVALGDQYSAIMKLKHDEIIKKLLEVEGFEYKGVVPTSMQYQ